MLEAGANLTFGASYVSKYQAFDTIIAETNYYYNVPKWVGAGDLRAGFSMKGWNALLEFAYKANDPGFENNFSYLLKAQQDNRYFVDFGGNNNSAGAYFKRGINTFRVNGKMR